jgi:hypothetical protein
MQGKNEVPKSPLLERLQTQLMAKGHPREFALQMARDILIKRGHLTKDGLETEEGKKRSSLTPEQRAIDRAIKRSGGSKEDYEYDPLTNRTRKYR